MHENEYVRCKPMYNILDSQHSHSRLVNQASDAMIDSVP